MKLLRPSWIVGVVALCSFAATPLYAAPQQQDRIRATGGDITIVPINHATLQIIHAGVVIEIDPTAEGDRSDRRQPDIILITDIHSDHFDPATIKKIRKTTTKVIAPAAVASQLEGAIVIGNGERRTVNGIEFEAIPMYNLSRGPAAGQLYHDKGRGNGYVVNAGGKRIYIAGDTEAIPEMRELRNIDVAFVPMNLPYTMTPLEAADAVKAFKPAIVYPYHYRDTDPNEFVTALRGTGIEVRVRDWYANSTQRRPAAGVPGGSYIGPMQFLGAGIVLLHSPGQSPGFGLAGNAFQGIKPISTSKVVTGVAWDFGFGTVGGKVASSIIAGARVAVSTTSRTTTFVQVGGTVFRRGNSAALSPAIGGGVDYAFDRCYRLRVELQVLPGDADTNRLFIGISMPVRRRAGQ